MDILHIVPSYYPAFKYGGPIESVHLLNKTLVKKNINVDVLTTNTGLERRQDIALNKWNNLDGVKIKYLPSYFYEHYTFSPHLFFAALSSVEKYDLVHITAVWNFPVLAGSLASLINKKPYVLSPRGALYDEAISLKSRNLKMIYFHLAAQHCLKKASAVHFTTEHEKDNVAKSLNLHNQSFVIPNGLDLTGYEKLPERGTFKKKYPVLINKKYILFLGRLNKQKGLDILIESVKKLFDFDDNLFFVIAGPDNFGYKKVIEKQLSEYGLLNRTLFTGMLTGTDKLSAYVDAEVFVLSSYFENFGMAVVEAMACRTPVVISDRVGIAKNVEKNRAGLVVDINPDSIFNGLKSLIDNKMLKDEIALNGRQLVEKNYNIDIIADQMIAEYEKILRA